MNIEWARTQFKIKAIQEIPMRVAHYDRVSTDSTEQLNSLRNQFSFNEDYIKSNPNWVYAGRYVDEGTTGISTSKREDFQRLVKDAKIGKFDFVITKEISRFARNTLDSIRFTRELLSYGVCVLFQNDNINTLDEDSEFRLTIMAGVAQEEVRKLSSRIKYGHRQSIKKGVYLGRDIYGYQNIDKCLVVDDRYADMIRYIFKQYATGESSTNRLADEIYEQGYRSFKGGKIDSHVIQNIIKNPKYKGYYCGGKVKIVDMFTKKQEFLPEEDWVMYKDDRITPLVSEELWDTCIHIYRKRGQEVKSKRTTYKTRHLLTGLMFCAHDDSKYWLKSRGTALDLKYGASWMCGHKIKNKAESCPSRSLRESNIKEIVTRIINTDEKTISKASESLLARLKKGHQDTDYDLQLSNLEKQIITNEKKRDKLLGYNIDGRISDNDFIDRDNKLREEIEEIVNRKQKLLQQSKNADFEPMIKEIKNTLLNFKDVTAEDITYEVVHHLFEKIVVDSSDAEKTILYFYLKGGERYKIEETALCGQGNMIKKMIEQQERQMAGK